MKILRIGIIAVLLLALLMPVTILADVELYESNTVGTHHMEWYTPGPFAQTFTPDTSHYITYIEVNAWDGAGNPGTVTFEIQLTTDSKPNGTVISTGSKDFNGITEGWTQVMMSSTAAVSASSLYAIVMYGASFSSGNHLHWHNSDANDYSDGALVSIDSASPLVWQTPNATVDLTFKEYGVEATGDPIPITGEADNLTYYSAVLWGNLNSIGSDDHVHVGFEYGLTDSYGSTVEAEESPLTGVGVFSAVIGNLADYTEYHYRAYSTGALSGTINGEDSTFSTLSEESQNVYTVKTMQPEFIKTSKGTELRLPAIVTSMGDETAINLKVEWGTTNSYGHYTTSKTVKKAGLESYTYYRINNPAPGSVYYYRAFANGSHDGTVYGSMVVAETDDYVQAEFTTDKYTDLKYTSVTVGATLWDLGSNTTVDFSLIFDDDAKLVEDGYNVIALANDTSSPAKFTYDFTSLTEDTDYFYRAKLVDDDNKTYYGDTIAFHTPNSDQPTFISCTNNLLTGWGATGDGPWWMILLVLIGLTWVFLWSKPTFAGIITFLLIGCAIALGVIDIWMVALLALVGAGIFVLNLRRQGAS